jgi:hypothetical protein
MGVRNPLPVLAVPAVSAVLVPTQKPQRPQITDYRSPSFFLSPLKSCLCATEILATGPPKRCPAHKLVSSFFLGSCRAFHL